jgi:hypothetical protein
VLNNNNIINGSLMACYLEKVKWNIYNKGEYPCNTIKDFIPILLKNDDEISIQVKSKKSSKIDPRGTKFIISKIG